MKTTTKTKTKQNKTKQNKTKQNKNKTKQNKTNTNAKKKTIIHINKRMFPTIVYLQ
jgi:hypothetical protein